MKVERISKIAGLTLAGFVVASVAADKGNLGPVISQVAGFAGAFIGSLVGGRKSRKAQPPAPSADTAPTTESSTKAS